MEQGKDKKLSNDLSISMVIQMCMQPSPAVHVSQTALLTQAGGPLPNRNLSV